MLEQITASAGSGKTFTLTRRFLALLKKATEDGSSPSCSLAPAPFAVYPLGGILAATFTNKAAAEMKSRVIRDLKEMALVSPQTANAAPPLLTQAEAARWLNAILRRYDALNIRTIDSLLTLLVRLNVLSLNLPPDFAPVFDDNEYFAPIYDALIDNAATEDETLRNALRSACRGLILYSNVKGFSATEHFRSRLLDIAGFAFDGGAALPDSAVFPKMRALHARLGRQLAHHALDLRTRMENESLHGKADFINFLEACRTRQSREIPTSEYAKKASLGDCLLKKSAGSQSPAAERSFAALCDSLRKIQRCSPLLRNALELEPFVYMARQFLLLLQERLHEEGGVPAKMLPSLALQAVSGERGVSDAYCRMGNAIVHLLFDEFQDTSREQWKSIFPLAEESLSRGGSLTYVGDVKQAIYNWRGGDSALFDDVLRDASLAAMLPAPPKSSGLDTNWRSAPAIVQHNNAVFSRLAAPHAARSVLQALLPGDTPPFLLNEAVLSLTNAFAGANQKIAPCNAHKPGMVRLVRIHEHNTENLDIAVENALRTLFLDNLLPRRAPGEIAVLVRNNDEATQCAAWLTAWGCPVVTDHSFSLGEHPLIQRLIALLTFLDCPFDDISFWAFISGPECFPPAAGMDRAHLTDWLAASAADPLRKSLHTAFRRDFPEQWQRWIAPFHDHAGLMSAYDAIVESARRFRLFERMPEQAPFLRRFMEVAYAAEGKGHTSLSGFLEFWQEKGDKEKVPLPEHMDAVRIITMHQAKGLEFPVVVIPFQHHSDLALANRAQDAPLTTISVDGLPMLTRQTAHTGEPYFRARIRTAIEQINLLYVAWTRPMEELHAFLTNTDYFRSRPGMAQALSVLLEEFPFAGNVHVSGEEPADSEKQHVQAEARLAGPGQDALIPGDGASPWRPMAWLPRLKIFRNPLEGTSFTERRRGLLAHACLEALRPSGNAPADAEQATGHAMRNFPLPMSDPEGIRREMIEMLIWYASLPKSALWLRLGSREQSLMDSSGNLYRVDLLVDEGDEGFLAVEYKTGRPDAAHKRQVRGYLDLLGRACGRRARGMLVYLDDRSTEEVVLP